ncbi:VC0807 family protein [Microbacterium gorillae]|uniref:VC0807 family protein n=1 Tax=Microbacterium gorillae TaxID=1231063 RepID=UPI003D964679
MTADVESTTAKPWFLRLVVGLVLDVGIWLGLYYLVLALGGGVIGGLIAAGSVALVRAIYLGIRTRTLDAFLALVVLSFIASILLALLTADPRVLLWKGVLMTAVWGITTLLTLRFAKPLLFSITQRLVAPGPDGYREWSRLWATSTPFRWLYRRLTLVWGATFLVLAVVQSAMIIMLSAQLAAPVGAAVSQVVYIGLIAWTIAYSRYAERSLNRPLVDDDNDPHTASDSPQLASNPAVHGPLPQRDAPQ